MTSKKYIENIKTRQLRSDKEFVLDSLTGAIDRLQKAFPRFGSFLMEFVQNADDAGSDSLTIEFAKNTITVSNNGAPFSEKDVKSICKVGRSSKTPRDYIGYLGVGFKAVFLISECPQIYSGGYHFKFDKSAWDNPEHTPWQIIPLWVDDPNVDSPEDKTTFVLPLKTPNLLERLKEEVKTEQLNSRILLFLRNIYEIKIKDVNQNTTRRLTKSEISKTPDYEIYQVQEYQNGVLESQDRWVIFRSVSRVPSDVKNDYVTKEWERDIVEKREILTAFKLDEENNLIREEEGTAHIGVFSFLPLKEIPSGLNFLLQADFLTSPGRGELSRECLWNEWLVGEVYNLVVKQCIPKFLTHDKWKMTFTDILYSSEGGHPLFTEYIKDPLNHYLEKNSVLIDENGTPSKTEELVLVTDEIRELLSDKDLKLLYPQRKVIHRECRPHPSLEIKKAPEDVHSFVRSSESEDFIKQKARDKDIKWFKKLYSMFVDKYSLHYFEYELKEYHYYKEHSGFWDRMQDLFKPIILTKDYTTAKINESYVNPKRVQIPEQLKDRFKTVHPQIGKDEKFNEFRRKLNDDRPGGYSSPTTKVIRELTKEDIKNALKQQEVLELDKKKWKNLPEEEKVEKIKQIKKLREDYSVEIKDYKFITLKGKSGKWERPEELVLTKNYNPEHNIEELVSKDLVDYPIKFVSSEFIKNCDDDKVRGWRKFFEELGVDKILNSEKEGGQRGKIVERIGVLTTLKYERKSGRAARELGESEAKQEGCDVVSESDKKEKRYIEVKGRSRTGPNIFLTPNEFKTLRDKEERYFIYMILDALRRPTVYAIQGNKLLEVAFNVVIPFNEWRDLSDEEFQP